MLALFASTWLPAASTVDLETVGSQLLIAEPVAVDLPCTLPAITLQPVPTQAWHVTGSISCPEPVTVLCTSESRTTSRTIGPGRNPLLLSGQPGVSELVISFTGPTDTTLVIHALGLGSGQAIDPTTISLPTLLFLVGLMWAGGFGLLAVIGSLTSSPRLTTTGISALCLGAALFFTFTGTGSGPAAQGLGLLAIIMTAMAVIIYWNARRLARARADQPEDTSPQ